MKHQDYSFDRMSQKELRHAIKRADLTIFEDVLRFLEHDSRDFGSGYIKQLFWKYVKRYDLNAQHLSRLENAAMQYLYRPMSCEYKYMCQTMCCIATDAFWVRVKAEIDSDRKWAKLNASCLYPYSRGMKAGETLRLAWKNRPDRWIRSDEKLYYMVDELVELIVLPEHWHNGQIIYCEPNAKDMPIIHYNPSYDSEIASLDVASGNKESIFQLFSTILRTGTLHTWTSKTWLYTIYLLYRINDDRAVQLLSEFLTNKLDYKFESPSKGYTMLSALKVLRFYNTDEALKVIKKYQSYDEQYKSYYPENSEYGWLTFYPSGEDKNNT